MKVLSTTTWQPRLCATSLTAAMSVSPINGLVGVSIYTNRVFFRMAFAYISRIGSIDVGELQAKVRQHLVEQPRNSAVQIVGRYNVFTRLHQGRDGRNRRHSAGEDARRYTTLQRSQVFFQSRTRRVSSARVVIALCLAQFFLCVRGCRKDGGSNRSCGGIRRVSDVDGARSEPWLLLS